MPFGGADASVPFGAAGAGGRQSIRIFPAALCGQGQSCARGRTPRTSDPRREPHDPRNLTGPHRSSTTLRRAAPTFALDDVTLAPGTDNARRDNALLLALLFDRKGWGAHQREATSTSVGADVRTCGCADTHPTNIDTNQQAVGSVFVLVLLV